MKEVILNIFISSGVWNISLNVLAYIICAIILVILFRRRKHISRYLRENKVWNSIKTESKAIYKIIKIERGYIYKPVERDRLLFAKSGKGLLIYSVMIAVLIPCIIIAIVSPFSLISDLAWYFCSGSPDELGVFAPDSNNTNIIWAVLSQYTDPGNLHYTHGLGSIVALLTAVFGIVCLSGLFVSSIVNVIARKTEQWKKGLLTYDKFFENYVVIIGVNEQTASLIRRSLSRDNVEYVLIQTRKDVEKARMELELKLDEELEEKIVFYSGERTSTEDISKLHLEKAIEVFILGENVDYENEKDHDAFNINCLEHISEYVRNHKDDRKNKTKRLRVHVDFEYQSTFTAFKATHLYQNLDRDIEFVPFNVHEIWAKKILVDSFAIVPAANKGEVTVQRYYPIDTYIDENHKRIGITPDCSKTVHLVVFGMNQMGTALATQAALLCHFPNFSKNKKLRTTITFIDDHAVEEAGYFMGRFASLFELSRFRVINCEKQKLEYQNPNLEGNLSIPFTDNIKNDVERNGKRYGHLMTSEEPIESFLDIQWEFIQGNVCSTDIQRYVEAIAEDKSNITTLAVCFNNSQQSLATAMYLPMSIYNKINQVLVYQQNIFDVVKDVSHGDSEWKRYPNLFPFGMIEGSYTENPYDSTLAKLAHYIYTNRFFDLDKTDISLLDTIDSMWGELGIVQKLANIDSIDSIPIKLRSLGVTSSRNYLEIEDCIKDNKKTDVVRSEHIRWMTERLLMGFRFLTKEEQDSINVLLGEQRKIKKNILKDQQRAHLDICSVERLEEVDCGISNNDENVITYLPVLLKGCEWINVLRISNPRYSESHHVAFLKDIFVCNDHLRYHFVKGLEGNNKNERGPRHSYWISETTVTQGLWKRVMGQIKDDWADDDMPVVNVSKNEIDDFLDVLRKKIGMYVALPSQKEWRYAAELSHSETCFKNTQEEGVGKPVPVSSHWDDAEGRLPLYHMLGNVWEWTNTEDKGLRYQFCGPSFRFKHKDCNIDKFRQDDDQYWHTSWNADMKSDDLGFRLIWKFDTEQFGKFPLEKILFEDNSFHESSEKQVADWFGAEKHQLKIIESGIFIMGKDKQSSDNPDVNETPQHKVQISKRIYMCQIPVTQNLWNIVTSQSAADNPTTNRLSKNLPQTNISWKDINEKFLVVLNSMLRNSSGLQNVLMSQLVEEDRQKLINGEIEFRLPTEAEWEYAAKEGSQRSETLYAGSNNAFDVAWFEQTTIQEVGKKEPNLLGLYDMSGNIWEWCYDYYISDMYVACQKGENPKIQKNFVENQYSKEGFIIDPVALDDSYSAHVFRGGSWASTEWDCRCSRANFWIDTHKANDLGFRLVLGAKI